MPFSIPLEYPYGHIDIAAQIADDYLDSIDEEIVVARPWVLITFNASDNSLRRQYTDPEYPLSFIYDVTIMFNLDEHPGQIELISPDSTVCHRYNVASQLTRSILISGIITYLDEIRELSK